MGMFDKLRGLIGRGREEAPQEAEPQQPPAPAPAPAAPAEGKKPGRLRRLFSRKAKPKPEEQPPAPAPAPTPAPSPAVGGEAPPPAPPGGGAGGEAGGEDEYADAPDSLDVNADGEWVTSGSTWDGSLDVRLSGGDVKAFLRAMDHGDTATAAQLVADAASSRDGNTFGQALTPGECTVDFFYNGEF